MSTNTEDREEAARLRAQRIVGMPLAELLKDCTVGELRAEQLRVSREFERPVRTWAIGVVEAQRRLDVGLERVPAYVQAALSAVRREVVESSLGPSPATLLAAFVALDCADHERHVPALRACLGTDGQTIVDGDPRGDAAARRRRLEERRTAIGRELERRDLQRRGVLDVKGRPR